MLPCLISSFENRAHNLMTGNYAGQPGWKFTLNDMQIGPAHPADTYFYENLIIPRLRHRDVAKNQRMLFNRRRRFEDLGFHESSN